MCLAPCALAVWGLAWKASHADASTAAWKSLIALTVQSYCETVPARDLEFRRLVMTRHIHRMASEAFSDDSQTLILRISSGEEDDSSFGEDVF